MLYPNEHTVHDAEAGYTLQSQQNGTLWKKIVFDHISRNSNPMGRFNIKYWARWWHGAQQVASHYLIQLILQTQIDITRPRLAN